MHKFWLVARNEYLKTVRRRAFVLSVLGIPLFIILIILVAVLVAMGNGDDRPLGYVDLAGVVDPALAVPAAGDEDAVAIQAFADEASARAALESRQLQAYYVLPADYLDSRQVDVYYWDKEPGEDARAAFDNLVQASLLADLPAEARERVLDGPELTIRSADGRREMGADNWPEFVLPLVAAMFFVFAVMMSAGYLLQVVSDEKENRTVEIMMTSLSPMQLIGGKAIGLMAVSLTQLLVWIAALVVGLVIGAQFWPILASIRMPWALLGVVTVFFLPAFALIAGLMTAIGSVTSESRQAQQIGGVLNLLFVLPLFFTALIIANPSSPLLVAMTLFPTTSFITITMRWGATVIPAWQLISSWIILVATALLAVWLAARVFRAGMLRYGQSLQLRGMVDAVRGR